VAEEAARMKLSLIFGSLIGLLFYYPALAKKVIAGRVITDVALVYTQPDFDSEPIAHLKKGAKLKVINKRYNVAFFKVELPTKKVGYMLDIDIAFAGKKEIPKGPLNDDQDDRGTIDDLFLDAESYQKGSDSSSETNPNNFDWERLIGIRNHFISYREKTMGRERRSDLSSLGLVWRGPDWFDFASYTDAGLSLTTQAPDFYQSVLGTAPRGFIGWGYMLLMTSTALNSRTQMVYGFGPFLRGSSFQIAANTSSGVRNYDATDLKLGGMGSWGFAYRFKPFAIRADFQFWWEASQYTSLSLSIEVPFPK